MNNIQKEIEESKKYLIKTTGGLVDITKENVAKIEAMIQTDSDYRNSTNFLQKGSCAYCMNELKKVLIDGKRVSIKEYRSIILNAVIAVDKENSTHLNADKCGRVEITDRIVRIKKDKLKKYLYYPDETKLKIIDIISEPTHPNKKKYRPRKNVSFASKFSHYACLYLFGGKKEQDNFSIYDNILKREIPKYAKKYQVAIKNIETYKEYREVVDKIIKASGSEISRNGFDHLIWYYHKGEKKMVKHVGVYTLTKENGDKIWLATKNINEDTNCVVKIGDDYLSSNINQNAGDYYFSLDGKTIYNYFSKDRKKLTKKQLKIVEDFMYGK